MADIKAENPRVMNSNIAGVRPSLNRNNKLTFLKPGAIFINLQDNIMCVGMVGGGWIEFQLTRVRTVV